MSAAALSASIPAVSVPNYATVASLVLLVVLLLWLSYAGAGTSGEEDDNTGQEYGYELRQSCLSSAGGSS